MEPPKDIRELQSFLGMISYLNRFAQTSQPIRNLIKKDVAFQWQSEQQIAFQQIKEVVSKAPVLSYYGPEKENIAWPWMCAVARRQTSVLCKQVFH